MQTRNICFCIVLIFLICTFAWYVISSAMNRFRNLSIDISIGSSDFSELDRRRPGLYETGSLLSSERQRELGVPVGAFICDTTIPSFVNNEYDFAGSCCIAGENHDATSPSYLFLPISAKYVRVKCLQVNVAFQNIIMTFKDDMWSKGITTASSKEDTDVGQAVDRMIKTLAHSVVLVGDDSAVHSNEQTPIIFTTNTNFNVKQKLIGKQSTMQNIDMQSLGGVMRIGLNHIEYSYELDNGEKQSVRVIASERGSKFGDKLMLIDDTWQYFDMDTLQFTIDRPNRPCTIWPSSILAPPVLLEDKQEEEEEEELSLPTATASNTNNLLEVVLGTLTATHAVPIPITLVKPVNFQQLRTTKSDHTVNIDLLFPPYLRFDAKYDINNSRKEQIMGLRLPPLELNALVTIHSKKFKW